MARWFKDWKKPKKETIKIAEGDPYFKFNIPTDFEENPHFFMSEELLSPWMNSTDTQRGSMFASHIVQAVHLKHCETPRVFTGFENQVGKYSVAYKRAEKDYVIVGKVWKNPMNYTLVVKSNDGVYDLIEVNAARHITEEYGYRINDCLEDKEVGDKISKDSFIYKSDNYDDHGNFGYGVNLNVAYIPWKGKTYEDGAVVTESAAEKLKSYKVEKTTITVNTNDILLNLYSDLNDPNDISYHSIPKVGEHTKGNILVASRREDAQNILYNFQQNRMKEINSDDQIYYTNGGVITDINIYSNISLEKLKAKDNEFTREVVGIYKEQLDYYTELAKLLETIIPAMTEEEYIASLPADKKKLYLQEKKDYGHYYARPLPADKNPNKYTEALDYAWKYAHEYIDDKISWRSDGKKYDNFKLELTILKENPLTIGSKITGR